MQKSFGARQEYRISWELFNRIEDLLITQDEPGQPLHSELASAREELTSSECPPYVWPVQTAVFLKYLWRNINKFAAGFEVVRALARTDLVTWEQTKMMAMFLRCLRFSLGGYDYRQESALWWSRRDRVVPEQDEQRQTWYGLGFSNTLPQYHYCWFEPRFNWVQLVFLSHITDQVLFGNRLLRDRYLSRGGQAQNFFQLTRQLDLALEWLRIHQARPVIVDRLLFWIIHICLRQFRVDILHKVKKELEEDEAKQALLGLQPFCYEYFTRIMVDDVYLTSGNKTEIKLPLDLSQCLFGSDRAGSWSREHWNNLPFRAIYQRSRTGLETYQRTDPTIPQRFERRFQRCLFGYHWILPHPAGGNLLQVTKQGHRMWYSITTSAGEPGALLSPQAWTWGRKSWQIGAPKELPDYIQWDHEQWREWIQQHASEIS
jgi:hypothetical protein